VKRPAQPASSGAVWQESLVSRHERWRHAGLTGATVWLTGYSAAGKSVIADQALAKLVSSGRVAYVLDADNLRHGLNSDLGFSPEDRSENARRVTEVARLVADAGLICLVPIISPYRVDRARARRIHEEADLPFFEVHVDTSLDVCVERDPKGLYRRALAGELPALTGISAPYEAPEHPELRLLTAGRTPAALADELITMLLHHLARRD
jgi:bifunctional enzyme CysN/CysC